MCRAGQHRRWLSLRVPTPRPPGWRALPGPRQISGRPAKAELGLPARDALNYFDQPSALLAGTVIITSFLVLVERAVRAGAHLHRRAVGVVTGAIRVLVAKTDLALGLHRIWGSMPELYLLIIFSAVLCAQHCVAAHPCWVCLAGWACRHVRAEFPQPPAHYGRPRAWAWAIRRSWAPHPANSLTPVVTFLPFRRRGHSFADLARFSGPGRAAGPQSLNACSVGARTTSMRGGSRCPAFAVLVVTLLLLTFMGDVRDALDKTDK